jgi:hypothetical protein
MKKVNGNSTRKKSQENSERSNTMTTAYDKVPLQISGTDYSINCDICGGCKLISLEESTQR